MLSLDAPYTIFVNILKHEHLCHNNGFAIQVGTSEYSEPKLSIFLRAPLARPAIPTPNAWVLHMRKEWVKAIFNHEMLVGVYLKSILFSPATVGSVASYLCAVSKARQPSDQSEKSTPGKGVRYLVRLSPPLHFPPCTSPAALTRHTIMQSQINTWGAFVIKEIQAHLFLLLLAREPRLQCKQPCNYRR